MLQGLEHGEGSDRERVCGAPKHHLTTIQEMMVVTQYSVSQRIQRQGLVKNTKKVSNEKACMLGGV